VRRCACARGDDTVARIGGDEFAVLVENVDDESLVDAIAERFDEAFRCRF